LEDAEEEEKTLLTGRYPQQTGALRNYGILDEQVTTIPEILKDNGYATFAVVSTAVLKKKRNLSQGFDYYFNNFRDEMPAQGPARGGRMGFADDANELVYSCLKDNSREPFFLFVNYYDVHSPAVRRGRYKVSFPGDNPDLNRYLAERYSGALSEGDLERIKLYDQAIAYTDDMIGQLLKRLEDKGLMDNTVVIITSDHGQGLGQHDGYWSHGFHLYDEITRVPLIVHLPDMQSGSRIEQQVMLTDLAPAICELAGIEDTFNFPGQSLVFPENLSKRPVFALGTMEDERNDPVTGQFSVRIPQRKIIHTMDGETMLFNIMDDPHELNSQTNAGSAEERKLIKTGYDWYNPELVKRIKPWNLDEDTRAELRALGYLK